MGFQYYAERAAANAKEEAALGFTSEEEKRQHRIRKFQLGADYLERDTGSWKEAEEHLRHNPGARVPQ